MEELAKFKEQLETLKKDSEKHVKEALTDLFSRHKVLQAVSMVFYRLYFDDGNPCYYELQDTSYKLHYEEELMKSLTYDDNERRFVGLYNLRSDEALASDLKEFESLVGKLAEYLEDIFEDSRITVWYNGNMEKQHYDHD